MLELDHTRVNTETNTLLVGEQLILLFSLYLSVSNIDHFIQIISVI